MDELQEMWERWSKQAEKWKITKNELREIVKSVGARIQLGDDQPGAVQ